VRNHAVVLATVAGARVAPARTYDRLGLDERRLGWSVISRKQPDLEHKSPGGAVMWRFTGALAIAGLAVGLLAPGQRGTARFAGTSR